MFVYTSRVETALQAIKRKKKPLMNQEPIQNHHVIVSKLNYSADLHGALVKRQEPLTKNKLLKDSIAFQ